MENITIAMDADAPDRTLISVIPSFSKNAGPGNANNSANGDNKLDEHSKNPRDN